MYVEITECTIWWANSDDKYLKSLHTKDVSWVDFRDWTNMSPLLDRVDVGHRRRYSRWVVRIHRECTAT